MIPTRERKIVILHLMKEGPTAEETVHFAGARFSVTTHAIGWDLDTAVELVKQYDGYADGIAISGIQKKAAAGKSSVMHPGYLALLRAAVRTPIYLADDVRDLFADWTLQRILKEEPQLFRNRRVLFHSALVSPGVEKFLQAGACIQGADALVMTGAPIRLEGPRALERYLKVLRTGMNLASAGSCSPSSRPGQSPQAQKRLAKWISQAEVFVSFGNMLDTLAPETLEALAGKVLIADYLSDAARARLAKVPVRQIIEFIPSLPQLEALKSRHFSLLTALIDQRRLSEDSALSFDEYILDWIQERDVKPNRLRSSSGMVRRCAFVVHPLAQRQLWKTPGLRALESAPGAVRDWVEGRAARLPVIHYGTLKGAVSEATGQEVECDIYGMPATPRQLLSLSEEFVYRRMIEAAEMAKKRGASLIGLGAYTKVVGDAGVTISRRSPIPVTNGNSYSASTTLWAARTMLEKMDLVRRGPDGRLQAKAMIIGATGSIGRVSALLIAGSVEELVLVATRPDKLLELRQEIQEMAPGLRVKVTTNPNGDLSDTDLIVTATSNQRGEILDIERVKPGAVICDCSRPLDISAEMAARRPDVLVIESGEVLLPGTRLDMSCDIGLPKPVVYACLAETVLLTMEGRYESFSLSKQLSMEKTKEIYRIGLKHGARLAEIQGPSGLITDLQIEATRGLALERLRKWPASQKPAATPAPGLRIVPAFTSLPFPVVSA